MEVVKIKDITEDEFMDLRSVFSEWYNGRGYINMLKVLYKDLVKNMLQLHDACSATALLRLLGDSGHIHSTDITIIYDTINLTDQYGLEKEIQRHIPLFKNVKEIEISDKFNLHRQKLMNLGMVLTAEDLVKISGCFITPVKEYADSWSLIIDLEKGRILCADKEKMETFIERLERHNLHSAVEALVSEPKSQCTPPDHAAVDVILGRRNGESNCEPQNVEFPGSVFDLLEKYINNVGKHRSEERDSVLRACKDMGTYFQDIAVKFHNISSGSLIFHLTVSDPAALLNLWRIHESKDLIKHLVKLLVPEKFQNEFLDKWATEIDRDQYEAGLRKLERKEMRMLNIATPEETYSVTSKRTRDVEHELGEPANPKKLKLKTSEVSRDEKHMTQLAGPSQKTIPFTAVKCKQDLPTNECEKQKLQTPSETEQEKIKQDKQTKLIQVEKIKDLKVELEMLKEKKSIKQKRSEEIKQEIMRRKKVLKLVFILSLRLQSLCDYGTKYRCVTDALADEIEQVNQKLQMQTKMIKDLEHELEMSKIEDSKEELTKQAKIKQEIEQRLKEEKSHKLVIQKLQSHKRDLERQHQDLEKRMADALTEKDMFKKKDSKEELKKYDKFEEELIMQRKEKLLVIRFCLQLQSLQSKLETKGQCIFDALMVKIEKEKEKYHVQRDKIQDLKLKLSKNEEELKKQDKYEQEIKQSNEAVKSQKIIIQQLEILQKQIKHQVPKKRMADMLTNKIMFEKEDSCFKVKTEQRSKVCDDESPLKKMMKMSPSEMYEHSNEINFNL